MISIILSVVTVLYFIAVSLSQKKAMMADRSWKTVKSLAIVIKIAPLIGIAIFSVLFIFVLKGRLSERIAHAVVVFALWLCAVQFYLYIIAYFKNKMMLITSVIGMLLSVALAVLLTPLDRYVDLQYSLMGVSAIAFSCAVFVIVYVSIWLMNPSNRLKKDN